MEANKKAKVNLKEIIDTLELSTMVEDGFSRSFVNSHTGQIVTLFAGDDFSDVEDEDLEGDWIPEHYIPLPDKEDLNEYEMMESFCLTITNEKIQDDLLNVIRGKGAFGRFKTAIHCHKIEKKWYQFREERLKHIAIEFCKDNHLEYSTSRSDS